MPVAVRRFRRDNFFGALLERIPMAIASEARTALQLPETDQLEGNSDLKEVIIDSLAERDPDGQEPLQEGVLRPLRAFDYVELPPGVAVSTPCSSEGGLQRLWEGGLFDVREYADVTLHTAWYSPLPDWLFSRALYCNEVRRIIGMNLM